ncbi:TetR/AcrR family transcriptional regulator, partial [Nocardia otitidiscaviarum]|uniref:TetR/AcrR family transcriptional regulator n=1 Tax=Nocardia otitidiscaviarum TaxID=1823 RepID=UPI0020CC4E35
MSAGPRDRLIESAIELVREQGVHGAGLSALLDRSRASRNSLYQHFPEGKGELVEGAPPGGVASPRPRHRKVNIKRPPAA